MATLPGVDIHAHYYPEQLLRLIEQEGPQHGARLDRGESRGLVIHAGPMRAGPITTRFTNLKERIADMDRQGVQVHALSLTVPMVYWGPGAFGLKLARAFNDGVEEAHAAHPTRMVGLAMLPMHEPDLALQELERIQALPAFRGVYMATTIGERELSDAAFRPVFARIEQLGLPVFLHPVRVIAYERLRPFYLNNLLGNPFDTAVAASHLICGGVLEQFPRLNVCLPHAGGALPILIGRLDHGARVRPELKHMAHPPSHYLRRLYYDIIGHSPVVMEYVIKLVGADRVLLGSDYCFDMGYEEPVKFVQAQPGLSAAERQAIIGGTARGLLKLG